MKKINLKTKPNKAKPNKTKHGSNDRKMNAIEMMSG